MKLCVKIVERQYALNVLTRDCVFKLFVYVYLQFILILVRVWRINQIFIRGNREWRTRYMELITDVKAVQLFNTRTDHWIVTCTYF